MAKHTLTKAGRTLDVIGTIIIIAAVVLCLMLAVPKLFGVYSYTVLTGSMEPSIPVGSLIYAKQADPVSLAEGDVIVFYDGMNTVPITHRVTENNIDEGLVTTQGDANAGEDIGPVPCSNIVGKVLLHIPVLGRFLVPLGTITGKIGMIAIIAAGLLLSVLGRRI